MTSDAMPFRSTLAWLLSLKLLQNMARKYGLLETKTFLWHGISLSSVHKITSVKICSCLSMFNWNRRWAGSSRSLNGKISVDVLAMLQKERIESLLANYSWVTVSKKLRFADVIANLSPLSSLPLSILSPLMFSARPQRSIPVSLISFWCFHVQSLATLPYQS